MRQLTILIIGVVTALVLLLLMNFTSPSTAGPLGILAVFLLIYVASVSFIYLVLRNVATFLAKVSRPGLLKLALEGTSPLKLYYYSSILALSPVILLGMQSVGGVRWMDLTLLIVFEILACFYIYKRF
ncbi:hypothetical protein EOM60_04185 [Candidatus Saccharibacteria bacterium]|nr:hypothetical protein [Candidatus Saccharibacteria bacterium]